MRSRRTQFQNVVALLYNFSPALLDKTEIRLADSDGLSRDTLPSGTAKNLLRGLITKNLVSNPSMSSRSAFWPRRS